MPSLSHLKGMSEVKTAEEIEANIKHMVGLQRDEPSEPPNQPQPEGEMSAFKKFVSQYFLVFSMFSGFSFLFSPDFYTRSEKLFRSKFKFFQ